MFLFSQDQQFILGFDINDTSIKIAQIKGGKRAHLLSLGYITIPPGLIVEGSIQDSDKLLPLIKKGLLTIEGKRIKTKAVVCGLPETQTFIKLLSFKDNDIAKLSETQILDEASKHFPLELQDAYIDWQTIRTSANETYILVAAATKKTCDAYIHVLNTLGFEVIALELASVATTRALLGDNLAAPTMILDFGKTHSTLIIVANHTLQFTLSIPLYGEYINTVISQKLKVSAEQAEKAKIVCGLDEKKCRGALKIVLDAIFDDLANKINDSIEFFAQQNPTIAGIERIILCGGGANFLKINSVLSERLKKTVVIGNALSGVKVPKSPSMPLLQKKSALAFSVAIGLGLGGTIYMN